MADFEEAGDDDVFRKVRKDFDAKGVAQSDQQIRTHHDRADGTGDRADQEPAPERTSPAAARIARTPLISLMASV